MKVLVLATAYPKPDGSVSMAYVHARNVYYKSQGISVDVLNFTTEEEYNIDGIKVFGMKQFQSQFLEKKYDILILHSHMALDKLLNIATLHVRERKTKISQIYFHTFL